MNDWTARRNDSESGSLRKDGRMTDWTTARVTPEIQAELRRLLDEATPGPWHAWDRGIGYEVHTEVEHNPIRCDSLNSGFRETFGGPNAQLIVAAVNALPALLDAVDERDALAAAVERVRELHKPEGIHRFCSMCAYRPWPCPTIRALDESETDR